MPLAIGLLGSYIIKNYPDNVDVRLFKFEDDFINEIDNWKPDLCLVQEKPEWINEEMNEWMDGWMDE